MRATGGQIPGIRGYVTQTLRRELNLDTVSGSSPMPAVIIKAAGVYPKTVHTEKNACVLMSSEKERWKILGML